MKQPSEPAWIKNPGTSFLPPTDELVHIELRGMLIESGHEFRYNQNPRKWDWLRQSGVEIVAYCPAEARETEAEHDA